MKGGVWPWRVEQSVKGFLASPPFLLYKLSCQVVTDGAKPRASAVTPKPCNCKISTDPCNHSDALA